MNKLILIALFFTAPTLGSDTMVTLPNQSQVLSLLNTYIVSWSPLTLKDISQEIATQRHSQTSLEKYLIKRMFGDTDTKCPELSFAAAAIVSQGSRVTDLSN